MDRRQHEQRLQELLDFDEEDLVANRDGRLSEDQADRMIAAERDRERRLKIVSIAAAAVGVVLLFVVPVLGVLGLAVAAGAFGIRSINRTRRGTIAAGDPVQTVKGRIELHRSSRNDNRGFDHRVWAGMQEGETAGGQALSAATEVFTVDKALWGELVDGGNYAIHHFRGKPVSVECRELPDDSDERTAGPG